MFKLFMLTLIPTLCIVLGLVFLMSKVTWRDVMGYAMITVGGVSMLFLMSVLF